MFGFFMSGVAVVKFELSSFLQMERSLPNLGMFYVLVEWQLVYCPVTAANGQSSAGIKGNKPSSSFLFPVSPPVRLSAMVSRLSKARGLIAVPLLLAFFPPHPLAPGCAQRTHL